MRLYRYKAKFKGEKESEAAFWYLRVTAVAMLFISFYWFKFTGSYFSLVAGFFLGAFAYTSLSIHKLRRYYYAFYSLVTCIAFVAFVLNVSFSHHYTHILISLVTLAYAIVHLALGILCFQEERAVT